MDSEDDQIRQLQHNQAKLYLQLDIYKEENEYLKAQLKNVKSEMFKYKRIYDTFVVLICHRRDFVEFNKYMIKFKSYVSMMPNPLPNTITN